MLLYCDPTGLIGDLVMDRIGLGAVAWEVSISSIFQFSIQKPIPTMQHANLQPHLHHHYNHLSHPLFCRVPSPAPCPAASKQLLFGLSLNWGSAWVLLKQEQRPM